MCTNPQFIRLKSVGYWDYRHGVQSPREVTVPCGKCDECLKRKQNSIAARIFEEAKHVPYIYFVTLTYAPEYEPWAATLCSPDLNTGALVPVSKPIPQFGVPEIKYYQELSKTFLYSSKQSAYRVFYKEIPLPEFELDSENSKITLVPSYRETDRKTRRKDEKMSYSFRLGELDSLFISYTPTLYFHDVQNTLKRWRIGYQRKNKMKLPDFKYVFFGEYGTEFTRRPHYHGLFIGKDLTKELVKDFMSYWTYGSVKDLKVVPQLNKDGTNAHGLLSKYVSKYVGKGSFDHEPLNLGLTLNQRGAISKKLGQCLPQQVIDYVTCQELKKFNPRFAESELSDEDKKVIIPEVANRLKFFIQLGPNWRPIQFAMPQAFYKQIFHCRRLLTGEYIYDELYYLVKDFIRNRNSENDYREFRQFCANFPLGKGAEACDAYHDLQKARLQDRAQAARANRKRIYQKRKHTN